MPRPRTNGHEGTVPPLPLVLGRPKAAAINGHLAMASPPPPVRRHGSRVIRPRTPPPPSPPVPPEPAQAPRAGARKVMQQYRTTTAASVPSGLAPGELAVNLASPGSPRMWVGVPTTIDPSGQREITATVVELDGGEYS